MDKGRIKGFAHEAKGTMKEIFGKATGDKQLEVEGRLDKAKGKLENTIGRVKDRVRSMTDTD